MELIYPSYYEKFHCIAGDCPDTCCKEWDVEIDPETEQFYRQLPGELGEKARENLYEEDGHTYLAFPEGKCPLLRCDGLCGMQAAHGEAALSQVCRKFPRLSQDYGSFEELGLEMSCPEAARIILTEARPSLICREVDGGEPGDYDEEVMAVLRRSRPVLMEIQEDEETPVPLRLVQMLFYGYHVQAQVDGGEETPFDREKAVADAEQFAQAGNSGALVEFYENLEILTDRWKYLLETASDTPRWSEELCRYARYGVYRYYEQAVSDYDLVGRIKMILCGAILASLLGKPTREDRIRVLQLYSKEIENDADNVDALLDGAYMSPAMKDRSLLGILLGRK